VRRITHAARLTAPALERAISEGWKNIHLLHDLLDEPTARHLRDRGISIGVWTV
jgi:hypothetical protein